MNVKFKSIDREGNLTEFTTEYHYENGIYSFNDESAEETTVFISYKDDFLAIIRSGKTNMELYLSPDETNAGNYKNDMGFEFNFISKTHKLVITKAEIYAEYSLFVENDEVNREKLWILLN